MTPGQVTKRTTSQSSTIEIRTGVTHITNNRVLTSTSSIPVSISNVEANHIPSTDQVNKSVPSSMSANASVTEGGSSFKKPRRGPTRGIGLVKRNEVAGNKLKVVIDVEHERPLNRIHSAKLSNELGQIARNYMPCPIKYYLFTEEEKSRAWERLLMRLDVVKCMINSWCRTQQKMPHNQGSAAFVPMFNELRQKEEGGLMPDKIALFKVTRCKNGKWITPEAEENYQKMITMLESSTSGGNSMTADQVYGAVMGKRSGYIKGMGHLLKYRYLPLTTYALGLFWCW